MKYILKYHELLLESSNSDSQQRISDIKTLVELGIADSSELGPIYRKEFIYLLTNFLDELGVRPVDLATPIQGKKGTLVLQFKLADVAKILSKVRFTQGLGPKETFTLRKAVDLVNLHQAELKKLDFTEQHWFIYYILKSDARYAIRGYGNRDFIPTSNRIVLFNGETSGDPLLAKFIQRIALDFTNYFPRIQDRFLSS